MKNPDFDLIADILRLRIDSTRFPAEKKFLHETMRVFTDVFRGSSPAFDVQRFIHRCGIADLQVEETYRMPPNMRGRPSSLWSDMMLNTPRRRVPLASPDHATTIAIAEAAVRQVTAASPSPYPPALTQAFDAGGVVVPPSAQGEHPNDYSVRQARNAAMQHIRDYSMGDVAMTESLATMPRYRIATHGPAGDINPADEPAQELQADNAFVEDTDGV